MRTEEFIARLSKVSNCPTDFLRIRRDIPLGVNGEGEVVFSRQKFYPYGVKHTAVTGTERTEFIRRLLVVLSALYKEEEACFFILSPKPEYAELMQLKNKDFTAIFVRGKEDLKNGEKCLKELLDMRKILKCSQLFIVLDGLEDLENCNEKKDLEEYREILDIARGKAVEVITGAELMKSIFSGYPGAFVEVGNCLVTTCAGGKADVTYVGEDASLSLPIKISCPSEPSVKETIAFLNALSEK